MHWPGDRRAAVARLAGDRTRKAVITARRRAGSGHRDPALDGLRGVAILLVFFFHYGGGLRSPHLIIRALGYATEAGWIGVILFFALSGFLITGSLWESRGERRVLLNFYMRRFLRIFPLYYLTVGIALLASLARGNRFGELWPVTLYAFFLQNLPGFVTTANLPISPLPLYHLWSLAVEEQFYLLWPALVLLSRVRSRALHLSLWVIALSELFRILTHLPIVPAAFAATFDPSLFTHAGTLALGAALALALLGPLWQLVQRWAPTAFFSGLAVYLLVSWRFQTLYLSTAAQFTVGLVGVSIACAAAIPLAMRPGRTRNLLSWPPLRFLGRISYGFYVFHIFLQPLFDFIATHITHQTYGSQYQLVRLLAAFPITAALAALSFYFFELPILARKSRFPMHSPLPESSHTPRPA